MNMFNDILQEETSGRHKQPTRSISSRHSVPEFLADEPEIVGADILKENTSSQKKFLKPEILDSSVHAPNYRHSQKLVERLSDADLQITKFMEEVNLKIQN